jgi:hypothetical protein
MEAICSALRSSGPEWIRRKMLLDVDRRRAGGGYGVFIDQHQQVQPIGWL